ncbi:MAG: hypothetical protein RMM98_12795 [Acidobacteriota bacterium]|nr:hypothetical protein [Blastocatellia bacterium]MDW8240486.1 hypothetical protein [Acidobacteriota bacterium]
MATSGRDRPFHFLIYLIAGAAMGGFLDMTAFRMETPIYGFISGALIAVLFQLVIWARSRKKGNAP